MDGHESLRMGEKELIALHQHHNYVDGNRNESITDSRFNKAYCSEIVPSADQGFVSSQKLDSELKS